MYGSSEIVNNMVAITAETIARRIPPVPKITQGKDGKQTKAVVNPVIKGSKLTRITNTVRSEQAIFPKESTNSDPGNVNQKKRSEERYVVEAIAPVMSKQMAEFILRQRLSPELTSIIPKVAKLAPKRKP